MRVGISTASFYGEENLEDTLAPIAACGAEICEVFLNTFSEYEPEYIELLQQRISECGLKVYSIHAMNSQFEPQLFSVYARQRQDAMRIYEKIMQAAQKLGAECYVFHGPSNMGRTRTLNFKRVGPLTRDLAQMAHEYGVKFSWENVSWCMFCEPEFALKMQDAAQTEHLKFTLDIKQAVRSGYDLQEYIRCMGTDIVNLHACDYKKENGTLQLMMPGQGECDFADIARQLQKQNYGGPAFLEVYRNLYQGLEEMKDSYCYLRTQLNSVGQG